MYLFSGGSTSTKKDFLLGGEWEGVVFSVQGQYTTQHIV